MKSVLIFVIIIMLIWGCSKDRENNRKTERYCYDLSEISFDFTIPDTIHFGMPAKISGYVNHPLTMKFNIDTVYMGEIIENGNLFWTPTRDKLKAGTQSINVLIQICDTLNGTHIVGANKKTFLK